MNSTKHIFAVCMIYLSQNTVKLSLRCHCVLNKTLRVNKFCLNLNRKVCMAFTLEIHSKEIGQSLTYIQKYTGKSHRHAYTYMLIHMYRYSRKKHDNGHTEAPSASVLLF